MTATSAWFLNIKSKLKSSELTAVFEQQAAGHAFKVHIIEDSCWLVVSWSKASRTAFRLVYSPNDPINVKEVFEKNGHVTFRVSSLMGEYESILQLPAEDNPVLRLTTTLKTAAPVLFPYWPRDIVPLDEDGEIYVKQVGTRSGQLFFRQGKSGSIFYLQNLTALADYNQQTETSAAETVGGEWPEIGFALPPTVKNKPLETGKSYILNDAFIAFVEEVPKDEPAIVRQFLDHLAAIYLVMPKPDTNYQPWPEILDKGLFDLQDSPGCWSQVDGNHYFNAYVCDYATPPEIMVQLAILLPLLDYVDWNDSQLDVMKKIKKGLPAFYEEKYGTIMRWHPKAADSLQGDEEQKQPLVMDAWYLHHPLLNLSRLALKGDEMARTLFLDSLEFSIKVAHHFKYEWPVFYKIDTLEVVKAETQPGMGGEKDVPGLYAHVMLQAWELTKEKRYLDEAETAAKKLRGLGFSLLYQANNTAFAAGALLRLSKITGNKEYKELSYLCLANIFKNVRLWDCNYGYGKSFPSFFTLFPLSDAPYSAVYEEQEVFCAFHDYLRHAQDQEILPSARLLIAEYVRFLVDRAVYYYPPMLPKEMLKEKAKTGEVDPNLWIALEDLHDGWEQSGEVGQEVYGAGNAFGILPRHYMQVEGQPFMIYTDYPTYGFSPKKKQPAKFKLAGDARLSCRLLLVKIGDDKLPDLNVTVNGKKEVLKGKTIKGGHLEYKLPGDSEIRIAW
jgi:hypothetical protein